MPDWVSNTFSNMANFLFEKYFCTFFLRMWESNYERNIKNKSCSEKYTYVFEFLENEISDYFGMGVQENKNTTKFTRRI